MKNIKTTKIIKRALQCLSTVLKQLGFPGKKYGYYIPYPYAKDLTTPQNLYPLKAVASLLDKDLSIYEALTQEAQQYNTIFKTFTKGIKTDPLAPRFNQDWFCGLDGAFAYTLIRRLKPKKIIEAGCGFSTRFLARAVKDANLNTTIYGINPKLLHAADELCTKFFQCTLDKIPTSLLKDLKAGDVLFIDASHLFMPGTDLEILFLDILPSLPKGVYIHFHDIFLPDNYPNDKDWEWWSFNEQQFLSVLLTSGGYKTVLPCQYLRKYHPEIIKDIYAPLHPRGLESSFWIVKDSSK